MEKKMQARNSTGSIHSGSSMLVLRLRTVAVYVLFFVVGMSVAVPGPTLVNMRSLFGTDTAMMSLSFSLHGVGYLMGAALCGILFERINRELQFCGAVVITASAFIMTPWSQSVYLLLALMSVFGFGVGYTATGGNAQVISMWKGHRGKDPILQGLQCSWSVGNTVAPFLISPFLTPLLVPPNCAVNINSTTVETSAEQSLEIYNLQTQDNNNNISVTVDRLSRAQYELSLLAASSSLQCHLGNGSQENSTFVSHEEMFAVYMSEVIRVRYAYLLVGIPIVIMLPLFVALHAYYKDRKQRSKHNVLKGMNVVLQGRESKWFRRGLLFQLFIFAFTCAIIINIADGYYALFVVENLNWTVKQGAILTSLFMGAKAIGRFLGIPLSFYFSSRSLLYINVSMCFTGHFLMLFTTSLGDVGMYVAVCTAGFGLSNINANLILWVSSNLHVTSGVSATFFMGLSSGFIIGYTLVGVLMQYMGNIWLIYALMTSSVVQVVLFTAMQIYIRLLKKNSADLVMELEVNDAQDADEKCVGDKV